MDSKSGAWFLPLEWMVSFLHMTVGSWDCTLSYASSGGGCMPWVKPDKAWSWPLTWMWSQTEKVKFCIRQIPPVASYLMSAKKKLVFSFLKLSTALTSFIYRVIHKSLRDFRTRLRNNQDRHGRKEHINRYRISPSFFCTRGLGVLPGSTARG